MAEILLRRCSVMKGKPALLPSSKSISNRALILKALSGSESALHNLSAARDTQLMQRCMAQNEKTADVKDAGTTMRFLTAYFSVTNQNKILTGSDRMKERPIGLLVDALRAIGAEIDYLEKDGFPPIESKGFERQNSDYIKIPAHISSQYISALMMMAPMLSQGLTIELTGKISSMPYIRMTASLMQRFGAAINFSNNIIAIPSALYTPADLTIEADWSAASYWFAFAALCEKAEIALKPMTAESLQGDRVITEIMKPLGVKSEFVGDQLILTKTENESRFQYDFSDCPDLAQTVIPVCAAKGISAGLTGLESLRVKETDRIAALQNEIAKIGAKLSEEGNRWTLTPGKMKNGLRISTYSDHRMAMGFAPWAALADIIIEEPQVTEKSYPGFWEDVRSMVND
ncbi:MAG: 3-phosphoshikimate 1-carboxyvinyltransferase [Candidatus Nephrothrix sp. EaCA]|nr:MAG: 3-phosphoshikimate 1-carboxyvinyltransferase [Candidatus Nephrothrix sp. EaCA]